MKLILNGAKGRMGTKIIERLNTTKTDLELVCGVDAFAVEGDGFVKSLNECTASADVIIDFSNHACTKDLLEYAVSKNIPCVLCTTGQTEEELNLISEASKKIAIFRSANMSIGVAVLADFARKAAEFFPNANIEIIEKHHNQKLDAPSGTALMIAEEIKKSRMQSTFVLGRSGHGKRTDEEIGIHAIRLGNVVGEHEVIFDTGVETITLKHEAHDRSLFADGAIVAAKFLCGKSAGMYDMHNITEG